MIHLLTEQIEAIQNDAIRDFTVDGLLLYGQDEEFGASLKTIVNYLIEISEVIEPDDVVKDFIISAGLLHGVGKSVMDARLELMPLMPKIGREPFDNILYLIERQNGFASPYPEYQPEIASPIHVWLLPMAKHLARRG
jgi:hypothetical protein